MKNLNLKTKTRLLMLEKVKKHLKSIKIDKTKVD